MGVQCKQERAEHTALGAPLLNANVEKRQLPIQTFQGPLVRKSNIQLQSVVLKLKVFSFPNSLMGQIWLHAELKSTNSIHM